MKNIIFKNDARGYIKVFLISGNISLQKKITLSVVVIEYFMYSVNDNRIILNNEIN